jgi:hypothetical protein
MNELKIIYEVHKPYGIRNSHGYLFYFAPIHKYTWQEERYRKEIEEQVCLADSLLAFLKDRASKSSEAAKLAGVDAIQVPTTQPAVKLPEFKECIIATGLGCTVLGEPTSLEGVGAKKLYDYIRQLQA